ncbi:MAG: F0F1 ATP synthase subunit A, partial [Polymorphobacter sp.]
MASPLEQFELERLVTADVMGYDVSFTNSAMFMVVTVVVVGLFLVLGMRNARLVPGRWQAAVETSHE